MNLEVFIELGYYYRGFTGQDVLVISRRQQVGRFSKSANTVAQSSKTLESPARKYW